MPRQVRQWLNNFAHPSSNSHRRQRPSVGGEADYSVGRYSAETVHGFSHTVTLKALITDMSNTKASMFLDSLPDASKAELKEHDSCYICMESFSASTKDKAVKTPCNHICGYACLKQWFEPSVTKKPHNSCPVCRRTLFSCDSQPIMPLIQDLQVSVGHLAELREITRQLSSPGNSRADFTRLLQEASTRMQLIQENGLGHGMISARLSQQPTMGELLIAYLEMVSRVPRPDNQELETLSRHLGRASDRLGPAIHRMEGHRPIAWRSQGPGVYILVGPQFRSHVDQVFAWLFQAERVMSLPI